jgi:hypothetical protein
MSEPAPEEAQQPDEGVLPAPQVETADPPPEQVAASAEAPLAESPEEVAPEPAAEEPAGAYGIPQKLGSKILNAPVAPNNGGFENRASQGARLHSAVEGKNTGGFEARASQEQGTH